MANTITNTRINAGKRTVTQSVTIASDGTELTDTVVYDSSAVATALGIADPLSCTILRIRASSNTVSANATLTLEFDATTDVLAYTIPLNQDVDIDFRDIGGLKNTAGSGITGDITITSTTLTSGDSITLILEVKPR